MFDDLLVKYTQCDEELTRLRRLQESYPSSSSNNSFHLQQENHVLKIKNNKINDLKSINPDNKYDELYAQYTHLKYENQNLQTINQKLNKENSKNKENKQIIEQLKKDLASAQRDILEMTNIVGVKQTLPTVQETLSIFHNIRDQQHHNTCTKLKKYIKKNTNKKLQKYYINQIIHKFMFETLKICQFKVENYKNEMFKEIADKLNMDYALKAVYYDNNEENENQFLRHHQNEEDQAFIDGERDKILGNRLGSFLRENYKYILRMNPLKEDVIQTVFMANKEFVGLRDKGNEEVFGFYEEYVVQCIEVCWVMLLQEPVLKMMPKEWRADDGERYDDDLMKRVLGSDRKCKFVLYYVWPNLMRDENVLKNQKMEVITREKLFAETKVKK